MKKYCHEVSLTLFDVAYHKCQTFRDAYISIGQLYVARHDVKACAEWSTSSYLFHVSILAPHFDILYLNHLFRLIDILFNYIAERKFYK